MSARAWKLALCFGLAGVSACGGDSVTRTGDAAANGNDAGDSGLAGDARVTGFDAGDSGSTGFDAGDSGSTGGALVSGLDARPANPTCLATAAPQPASTVSLERAFPNLSFSLPVGMFQAPGDDAYWYVIEQAGAVKRFEARADVTSATTVLNVPATYTAGNDERGLLGLAFHPDFASNGQIFVMSVQVSGAVNYSLLQRYTSDDGGASFGAPTTLLSVRQPNNNHNGGALAFGPDGFLYASLGDGGGSYDPDANGQNTDTLLGSILRIDVDGGDPYAIPADNPFASGGGAPEIYAYGLRNPWRFSFDTLTGELWAADVGQSCFEEVDLIERGGNYGWPVMEAAQCTVRNNCNSGRDCALPEYIDPVASYGRSEGQSITGGYVYRGSRVPELEGSYLYGDFASGRIWGLRRDQSGAYVSQMLLDSSASIASFGQGVDGEVYVVDRSGALWAVAPGNTRPFDPLPRKLSETGCVNPSDPTQPAAGVLPYVLRAPFWSDGARKERFFALPDGATFEVNASGELSLPPGGVSMKTFFLGDRRVETRFFVRHPDGSFSGYTYAWNDAQTDADLLTTRQTADVDGTAWLFPSRADCLECHTRAAGFSLGLELRQLDMPLAYPGGSEGNQIVTLDDIGMFSEPQVPPATPLARLDDTGASLEARGRTYLHVNCSPCHRPGGPGRGEADMRFDAPNLGICDVVPLSDDLGVSDARLFAPGAPDRSLVALRPARRDEAAMPPLASLRVDEQGVALLRQWIESAAGCP